MEARKKELVGLGPATFNVTNNPDKGMFLVGLLI